MQLPLSPPLQSLRDEEMFAPHFVLGVSIQQPQNPMLTLHPMVPLRQPMCSLGDSQCGLPHLIHMESKANRSGMICLHEITLTRDWVRRNDKQLMFWLPFFLCISTSMSSSNVLITRGHIVPQHFFPETVSHLPARSTIYVMHGQTAQIICLGFIFSPFPNLWVQIIKKQVTFLTFFSFCHHSCPSSVSESLSQSNLALRLYISVSFMYYILHIFS
jgi:hypothetical protein